MKTKGVEKKSFAETIMEAKRPEEVFGDLDAVDRPGFVGNGTAVRLANLVLACVDANERLLLDTLESTETFQRKLWLLYMQAARKIRAGTYGKK